MAEMRSIFQLDEFKPYKSRYHTRRAMLLRQRRYVDGSIYDDSHFKMAHKLYAQTKGLFSLLARAVEIDVALTPGMMGAWDLSEGATNAQRDAQATLYRWSEWATEGDDWLEDGATVGRNVIKIVPDGDAGVVRLQRVQTEQVLRIGRHLAPATGQMAPLALIVDPQAEDGTGERYEYAEAITPAEIRTYRNGAPWAYNEMGVDRWPNPLGVIPLVHAQNDTGGRPTWSKCGDQIVAVNELASYLNDIIGRHAEPQWAFTGVDESEVVKSGDNVWTLPVGADVKAILATVDIPGTLEFVRELKLETKANLPELSFDDLRAKDQIATETLYVQLIELRAKVWKMRRRYDGALIGAHQMAAIAATIYGIGELAPLLDPHSMDAQRPVLPQSKLDRIREEEAELALEMQKQLSSGEGMTSLVTQSPIATMEILRG